MKIPCNCERSNADGHKLLDFVARQRRVHAEYGFWLSAQRHTREEEAGFRRYRKDYRRNYYKEHYETERSQMRAYAASHKKTPTAEDAAKADAFEEKKRLVKEKYGFELGVVPLVMTEEEREARKRYERDEKRKWNAAHKVSPEKRKEYNERAKAKKLLRKERRERMARAREIQKQKREAAKKERAEAERLSFIAEWGFDPTRAPQTPEEKRAKALYALSIARAKQKAEAERRKARREAAAAARAEARRLERDRVRLAREEAEREAALRDREAKQAAIEEREANRAAYLAAKAEAEAEELAQAVAIAVAMQTPDAAEVVQPVCEDEGLEASASPRIPVEIVISGDDFRSRTSCHPWRCLGLDETAPTDEEIEREVPPSRWSDYGGDAPVAEAGGGNPPNEPPGVRTGGDLPDEEDDDEFRRKREKDEKIRIVREKYGFTLGVKPVTPEEIEGKKRYIADRARETALRNKTIDFMLHHKERVRKAAAKKRKATIARKRREAAKDAARAAKVAERERIRQEREAARTAAKQAREEAKAAAKAARIAEAEDWIRWKPLRKHLKLRGPKSSWTQEQVELYERRKKAQMDKERRDATREERKARIAAKAAAKAERAAAREEKRRLIREKYGFTPGQTPVTQEEIAGKRRYELDLEQAARDRHREHIREYHTAYNRRKRAEELARKQAKWTPEQWSAWNAKQNAKTEGAGSAPWLIIEVAKWIASERGWTGDVAMSWLIERGAVDFLAAGAAKFGRDRMKAKSGVAMAARAVMLWAEPETAAMFGGIKK